MSDSINCWRCGQPFNVFPSMHGRRIICGRCEAPIEVGIPGQGYPGRGYPDQGYPSQGNARHASAPAPAPMPAPIPAQIPYRPPQDDPFYSVGASGYSATATAYSAGSTGSSAFERLPTDLPSDERRSRLWVGIGVGFIGLAICGLGAAIAAAWALDSIERGKAVANKDAASSDAASDGPVNTPVAPSGDPLISDPAGGPSWGNDDSGDDRFVTNPANNNEITDENPFESRVADGAQDSAENPFESGAGDGDERDFSSEADDSSGDSESVSVSAANSDRNRAKATADSNSDDEEFVFGGESASGDETAVAGGAGITADGAPKSGAPNRAGDRTGRRKLDGFSFQPPTGWRNAIPDNEVIVAGYSFDEDARGNMRGALLVYVLPMKLKDALSFVKVYTSDGEQKIVPGTTRVDGAVAYRLVGIDWGRIVYSIAFVKNGRAYIVEGTGDKDVQIMKVVQRLCDSWQWD